MKKTEEEKEKESKREEEDNKATNKLDRYSMMIIGKYFVTINDYINIEKTNKKYRGLMEQYRFNPIHFNNINERELFQNIQTYNIYKLDHSDVVLYVAATVDERIKQFIHWEKLSYLQWKKIRRENEVYKNVTFNEQDRIEFFTGNKCELEKGITQLGRNCFHSCSQLISIDIPNTVTTFGNYCFSWCKNLTEINIPTNVRVLNEGCFNACSNLSTITIPSSVSSLGGGCFNMCKKLTDINLTNNTAYYKEGNLVKNRITEELVYYIGCDTLNEITIPTSVSSLSDYCFAFCSNLSTINIPISVSSFGKYCFRECQQLESLKIPDSVKKIGLCCFFGCVKLTSVTLSSILSVIQTHAFGVCKTLKTIVIPPTVQQLGIDCFSKCSNLSTITIPSNVSWIGDDCFRDCNKLKGNIHLDENNPTFRTDGKDIFRKDNNKRINIW